MFIEWNSKKYYTDSRIDMEDLQKELNAVQAIVEHLGKRHPKAALLQPKYVTSD